MTRSLYPITERLANLLDVAVANGGELPEEIAAEWSAWFDGIEESEPEFLQDVVSAIEQLGMEAVASRATAEQWTARAAARERTVARLKADVLRYLQVSGQKKVAIADGRAVCSQTNGGVLPLVLEPVDPKTLPVALQKVIVELNTEAVREALESGEVLPFASLGPRGCHVRIR